MRETRGVTMTSTVYDTSQLDPKKVTASRNASSLSRLAKQCLSIVYNSASGGNDIIFDLDEDIRYNRIV
jgi:hypothetical protein